ncbi:MAG: hypothetical protein GY862_39485 [Gammaproteobacteria bacterium]|nr:hypothetical protein [Gammaproteobacteria bacterium]
MSPEAAKQRVFKYWDYIHKLAERRFAWDAVLKEQAVNYALDELAKNGWQRVRAYKGKGFTAFITITINRLFTDFARKTGDAQTMPKWLRTQGPLWKRAWFLLCVRRLGREETIQTLLDEALKSGHQEAYLREIVAMISTGCSSEMRIWTLGGEEDKAADETEQADFMLIFNMLERLLPEQSTERLEQRMQTWINCLRQWIVLKPEEYLMLKLVFDEGLSVSEAGRRLQQGTHEASGRQRRLLVRLRKALEKCGLEKDFWFDEE